MLTTKKVVSNSWWIATVISLVLVIVIIPLGIIGFVEVPQTTIPAGKHVKTGSRIFYNFLKQVNQSGDVIILGTSETGNSLHGNNYWALLDQDSTLSQRFYSLGGAGRCSYVYFPLILDKPEVFDGLNVILYINPTYWRVGLNKFRSDYYSRYVDSDMLSSVASKAKDIGVYSKFMKPANASYSVFPKGGRIVNDFRSLYYHDLNLAFNATSSKKVNLRTRRIDSAGVLNFSHPENMDLASNVTKDFLATHTSFPTIDTSSFQSEMLRAFIGMVEQYNINCVFYLGPINDIYGEEKNLSLMPDHYQTIEEIKDILNSNNQVYIDGTYQGKIGGTFSDVQHISEYGAYLTALQIKEYYEKNY